MFRIYVSFIDVVMYPKVINGSFNFFIANFLC